MVFDPLFPSAELVEELLAMILEILDLSSGTVGAQPRCHPLCLDDRGFDPFQILGSEQLVEGSASDHTFEVLESLVELLIAGVLHWQTFESCRWFDYGSAQLSDQRVEWNPQC